MSRSDMTGSRGPTRMTDVPTVRCVKCGATLELEEFTWDDVHAEGLPVREVHGKKAVPALCPEHASGDSA